MATIRGDQVGLGSFVKVSTELGGVLWIGKVSELAGSRARVCDKPTVADALFRDLQRDLDGNVDVLRHRCRNPETGDEDPYRSRLRQGSLWRREGRLLNPRCLWALTMQLGT